MMGRRSAVAVTIRRRHPRRTARLRPEAAKRNRARDGRRRNEDVRAWNLLDRQWVAARTLCTRSASTADGQDRQHGAVRTLGQDGATIACQRKQSGEIATLIRPVTRRRRWTDLKRSDRVEGHGHRFIPQIEWGNTIWRCRLKSCALAVGNAEQAASLSKAAGRYAMSPSCTGTGRAISTYEIDLFSQSKFCFCPCKLHWGGMGQHPPSRRRLCRAEDRRT